METRRGKRHKKVPHVQADIYLNSQLTVAPLPAFVHMLRDIYYAEKQIEKSLPKMIDKATNPQLKAGI